MLQDLTFIKDVTSKRQTYYVYESDTEYLRLTVNWNKSNSYNLSVVPKEATEYVRRCFGGKRVTASDVLSQARKPAYIKTSFDSLNTLYALCATGVAKIDHRFKGKALNFSIKGR